jgi:Protein of unknown function (DUF2877)
VTARTVPAAASLRVAELVAGPRRPAGVVASGPTAVYVDVEGDCIGVLARGAVAVPIGMRTTLDRLPEVEGSVDVGLERVWFDEYAVAVNRIVDVGVPRLGPLQAWSAPVSVDLPASALRGLAAAEASAALELLGRGDGLTPSGDDVIAGWLVARHATGRSPGRIADVVRSHASTRTTALSASLLRRAVAGETIPQGRDLLVALHAGAGVDAALEALVAVGHTSGAALAVGISLGLEDAV